VPLLERVIKKLEPQVAEAVRYFWTTRESQGERQGGGTKTRDMGNRTAVTGGAHCLAFARIVRDLVIECGITHPDIHIGKWTELPGYFRATKDWDVVVVSKGRLVAVVECKSQVGPSFGNNFNNRTEEALGNALDLWTAFREGAFKPSERPWLGYFMLLEDAPGSRSPVRTTSQHFKVFPEFQNASYAKRYELLCTRLVTERHYDAAWLMLSSRDKAPRAAYTEPSAELGFHVFAKSLAARAIAFATP